MDEAAFWRKEIDCGAFMVAMARVRNVCDRTGRPERSGVPDAATGAGPRVWTRSCGARGPAGDEDVGSTSAGGVLSTRPYPPAPEKMLNTVPALDPLPRGQLVTVVGNRPQFIKMIAVSRELERRGLREVVVHTGQHYDHDMNEVFFRELGIRKPDLQLSVAGRTHGAMTGELLEKVEQVFMAIEPRGVLVYGDTNSTLAAALAAVKLQIPVAHVESGPRLGGLDTPEEVNRIVADHCATLRFVNDAVSARNLGREGITSGVIHSGDVMLDVFREVAGEIEPAAPTDETKVYMTLHRPQNVDDPDCHRKIIDMIRQSGAAFTFPLHPRTRKKIEHFGLLAEYQSLPNLSLSGPVGYVQSLRTLLQSDFVVTDSGGVQREAYFGGKLSMLMLPETPWPELEASGWQLRAGWVRDGEMLKTFEALRRLGKPAEAPPFFGDGAAAAKIVDALVAHGFIGEA